MTKDTERAMALLKEHGYTCVLIRENWIYTSRLRGVRPLLELLENEGKLAGVSAADKTVGLGAAHLYLLLGVCHVWASVMSESAKELLESHGVSSACDTLVPYIINRAGNGGCPIEKAVTGAASSEEALVRIKETLRKLSGS